MKLDSEIEEMLFAKGADIIRFIDISNLPLSQTQGYARAILFCMALSKDFIIAICAGENREQEFVDKEHETDALADWLAEYLRGQGYRSYSQSEKSHSKNGNYDEKTRASRLPHKTIARLAGIGYIGKNNLLINEKYGCALSMCTVLTDAPLATEKRPLVLSQCGDCDICKHVCSENAILGNEWSEDRGRAGVFDVFKCTCALKCMVNCPQTLKYALSKVSVLSPA
jgi:epoxyqueuosine reductase QueG